MEFALRADGARERKQQLEERQEPEERQELTDAMESTRGSDNA
jgi:hypothetical protein